MRKKKSFYQIAAVLFVLGIVVGILCSKGLYQSHPKEIEEFFLTVGANLKTEPTDYLGLLKEILEKQLKSVGILMLFSISALGLPYIGGFLLYKGCITGFLLGSVLIPFGLRGVLLAVSLFFPQCFFYAPAYFAMLNKGYRFGIEGHERKRLYKELPAIFAMLAILITGCVSEAYGNTWILKQIFPIFM